jgi:hypothetical protein
MEHLEGLVGWGIVEAQCPFDASPRINVCKANTCMLGPPYSWVTRAASMQNIIS